jgi:hypothetical protein
MRLRVRQQLGLTLAMIVLALAPQAAYADNCGSLSDCYGTIAAALAAFVAIAAIILIIAFLPEILAALGLAAEATLSGAELAAAAEAAGFTVEEAGVIAEAESILSAPEIAQIAEAAANGESVVVNIGSRVIQYEPGLSASGMTMFGENGFLIGNEAFASEGELARTVLHELFRLTTSSVPEAGVSGATAAAETEAAFNFAARAYEFLKGLGVLL